MKYIIAIDSDGTLRKTDGTISDFTKLAIKKQIEKENIIVICTARPRYHTQKISNEVGANRFMISSNGSEIYDVQKQKIIWAKYLDKQSCKLLYDYSILNNIRIMFVLENTEYVTQFTRNDNQVLLTEDNFNEVINNKVKQVMVIGKEKKQINMFKEIVQSEYKMNILDSSKENSEETWFSVVSNEASKGIAVSKLAEYLNISKENIIAIGNDNNDISMIKIARLGVAVNNAEISVKEEADLIVASNDDDGVARFLNEFNLNKNYVMKQKYKLTKKIEDFIANTSLKEIGIGCSDSQVIQIIKDNQIYYLKIAKKGLLTQEYNALKWLDGKLSVPEIVLFDDESENEFLITRAILGEMVCSENYLKSPAESLKIIKEAFDNIYAVDISNCPFDVSNKYKLSLIERNVKKGLVKNADLKEETLQKFGSVENLLKYLIDNQFEEELCFSHGDTSLPNIFALGNKFSGFIDVGECGIADKWFDLAICEKSIKKNYGEEYISKFYKELNIIPDRNKLDYYLLMMELYL